MPFKLTRTNLEACFRGIPLDQISNVFQDACHFSLRLGIQYIWIDSLCKLSSVSLSLCRLRCLGIIQDSVKDWRFKSSQMRSIYGNAVLNVAATGFPNGQNGLFSQRDHSLLTPIHVTFGGAPGTADHPVTEETPDRPEHHKENMLLFDVNTWKDGVDEAPLCKRGWVAQERALSVRTIHFGREQLFWECVCGRASEAYPVGFVDSTWGDWPKRFLSRTEDDRKRMDRLKEIRETILRWRREDLETQREDLETQRKEGWTTVQGKRKNKRVSQVPGTQELSKFDRRMKFGGGEPNDLVDYYASVHHHKRSSPSLDDWKLTPQAFEGCDISVLDGLGIEGWEVLRDKLRRWRIGKQEKANESFEPRPIRGMSTTQYQWCSSVEIYSKCSLTYSKDKLVAISGIAKMLIVEMGCDYLAGLWRRDLEHQLLWKIRSPCHAVNRDGTRGPSWTWASVDGAVKIPDWHGYFHNRYVLCL